MGVQKDRKEALVLIPHQITTKHTECVHTCIMFVLSLIVNTATGSQSHGQALGLKSLMQSFLPASVQWMFQTFWKWKIHHDSCSNCKPWRKVQWLCQWMGVGISKHYPDWSSWSETWKAGGTLKTAPFCLFVASLLFIFVFFPIWWKLLYGRRLSLEMEEEMKPGTDQCAVLWFCSFCSWFLRLQDLTFTFQFRYNKRGVCTGV